MESRSGFAGTPRWRVAERSGWLALLLAILVGVALLAACCGGSTTLPSVASLETTSSSSSRSASSSSRLFPLGVGGFGASMSTQVGAGAAGVEYSACMRSRGIPNFPDPDAQGTLTITVSPSLDPNSPLFEKAEADCRHLVPAGRPLSPARQQQMKQRLLVFSACMRSHGFPQDPDPIFAPGGMVSQSTSRRQVDPSLPIYQAAQKACQRNRGSGG